MRAVKKQYVWGASSTPPRRPRRIFPSLHTSPFWWAADRQAAVGLRARTCRAARLPAARERGRGRGVRPPRTGHRTFIDSWGRCIGHGRRGAPVPRLLGSLRHRRGARQPPGRVRRPGPGRSETAAAQDRGRRRRRARPRALLRLRPARADAGVVGAAPQDVRARRARGAPPRRVRTTPDAAVRRAADGST